MNPLEALGEYLEAEDPRVLGNAVTALAALAGKHREACARLVDIALDAGHPASARARAEILHQDFPASSTAIDQLLEELGDEAACGRANELLVALDADPGLLADWPAGRKLAIGRRVRQYLARDRRAQFFWRAIKASWFGGVAGAVLLAIGLAFLDPPVDEGVFYALFLSTLVLSPIVGILVARKLSPHAEYFDRKSGAVLEVTAPVCDPWLWLVVILTLLLNAGFFWWPQSDASIGVTIACSGVAGLGVMLALVAVRGGNFVVGSAVSSPFGDRWIRGFGGGAAGLLTLTLFLFVLLAASPTEDLSSLAAESWFLSIPLVAAVAAVAAKTLRQEVRRHAPGSLRDLLIRVALAFVIVVLPTAWVLLTAVPVPEAEQNETEVRRWTLDDIPVSKGFRVDFPQRVEAEVESGPGSSEPRVLSLWRGRENLTPKGAGPIATELTPGLYRLEVTTAAPEGSFLGASYPDAVRRLAYRLAAMVRLQTSSIEVESFVLHLKLNTDPQSATPRMQVLRGMEMLQRGLVWDAVQRFEVAAALEATYRDSAKFWLYLCRLGSERSRAADAAEVRSACDRAVSLDSENADALDSRGQVRALVGDFAGALEDLRAAAEIATVREPRRRRWIEDLEQGADPWEPSGQPLFRAGPETSPFP